MILLNILNSLVPTAAIALVAWGALRLLRANAATRYGVWWVVLVSVVGVVLRPQRAPIVTSAAVQLPPATDPSQDSVATLIALAFAVWVTFALYRATRIIVGYVWLRRIQKNATPWSRPGVVVSDDVAGPITAGFAHPVIVLPTSFPEKLTDEEMQHVLLHEEAHIARFDQWANLAGRVIGVFFGLHPVAAFALNRIERERERACDDWVVAATGEAKPYAASLTRIFELTKRGSQPDLASGFMGSRLGGRIEELLTHGRRFTKRASIAMLAVIALPILVGVRVGLHVPGLVAYAQEPQPARPVTQAAPVTPVKPAIPVTQAPSRDAVADRLEALLTRLEAILDRMSAPEPRERILDQQVLEERLANENLRRAREQADRERQMSQIQKLRELLELERLAVEAAEKAKQF